MSSHHLEINVDTFLKSQYQMQYGKDINYMEELNSGITKAQLASSIPILLRTRERPIATNEIPVASNRIEREATYEYEFAFKCTDGSPCFCYLWDTDDLRACQRISCSNLEREQLSYNSETGVGFFQIAGVCWSFRKEVYQRSIPPGHRIEVTESEQKEKGQQTNADDILASL